MKDPFITSIDDQLKECGVIWKSDVPQSLPPYYYNGISYFYQDETDKFFPMNEQSLMRRLKSEGYTIEVDGKTSCSPYVTDIQNKCAVSYCGSLAGFKAGPYLLPSGDRILVTQSSHVIEPCPGDCSLIRKFVEGMLDQGGTVQSVFFYGWLQTFVSMFSMQLRSMDVLQHLYPGQCMVLSGPANAGKSFFVDAVLKPLFGGRVAKPHAYMSGKSAFNGDTAGAALLLIDDEGATFDRKSRVQFGSRIKEIGFAPGRYIHPKHREPIILDPVQRTIICVNDHPDHIVLLPTLDESMADKLMLLKATQCPMLEQSGSEDREALRSRLKAQIPAFVDFLLNQFVIPDFLKSKRCGVTHFHHPDLVALLEDVDPDANLMEFIDELFERDAFTSASVDDVTPSRMTSWVGSASKFEKIAQSQNLYWKTDRLFRYENSAGLLLRRLSQAHPNRVTPGTKINGIKQWIINPPARNAAIVTEKPKPPVQKSAAAVTETRSLLERAKAMNDECDD